MAVTVDISDGLLAKIRTGFQNEFNSDKKITALYKKISDGSISFIDANEFSIRVGEILSRQFKKRISADILPDGKMYYNIAKKVIAPALGDDYKLISDVCENIQRNIYSANMLGLKPIPTGVNTSRVNGIAWKMSEYDKFDDAAWLLGEPIINFSQSIVDEFIQVNTQFQYESGLDPKIIRTVVSGCCEWCQGLAGTYNYEDVSNTGNNVFRRHNRCRCTVDYVLNRKKQNVHTKKWSDATPEKIAARKELNNSNE